MLAVAVANGSVLVYKWPDSYNLADFSEHRDISVVAGHGECTCLSWNPAADEPATLIVGCLITTPAASFTSRNPDDAFEMECHLLQLVNVDEDRLTPMNGNLSLAASSSVLDEAEFTSHAHTRMINDVQWAPIAGRSYHLIASASKDRTVIIWRVVLKDIMEDALLKVPQVVALQAIDFDQLIQGEV